MLHHPATPCDVEKIKLNDLLYDKCKVYFDRGWYLESPIGLELELTRECNQDCIHCWNESAKRQGSMLKSKAKEIIDEFRGGSICLMGGEPLTHPYFFDILDYASSKGIKDISITTNGSLIDRDHAKNLGAKLTSISISLHGSDPKIHNHITRRDNFSKVLKSIGYLKENGLNPLINFTVMQENKHDLINILYFVRDLGVKGIKFNLLRREGRGKKLENIPTSEIESLKNFIYEVNKEIQAPIERCELYPQAYNRGIGEATFYGCSGLRIKAYIDFEGNVYPCSLIRDSVGNVFVSSLDEIWFGDLANEFRDRVFCNKNNCAIGNNCGGKCKA